MNKYQELKIKINQAKGPIGTLFWVGILLQIIWFITLVFLIDHNKVVLVYIVLKRAGILGADWHKLLILHWHWIFILILSFTSYFLLIPIKSYLLKDKSSGGVSEEKAVRGTKFEDIKKYKKDVRDKKIFCNLGGVVPVPLDIIYNHFRILGAQGTGKTQTIARMINETAHFLFNWLILDPKNDYTGWFYNPDKDIIFNPADARCPAWNILDEIENKADILLLVNAIVPDIPNDNNKMWVRDARQVLESIIYYLKMTDQGTNENLIKYCNYSPAELVKLFKSHPEIEKACSLAIPHLQAGEKVTPILMGVVASHIKAFDVMPSKPDRPGMKTFNIRRDFLSKKGVKIFLNSNDNSKDLVRPVLTIFVEFLARKFLSAKDGENNTTIFAFDELSFLDKIPAIIDLEDRGRSKMAVVVAGIQDYGKTTEKYGDNLIRTIINNLRNTLTLAVADEKLAKTISDEIGVQDVERYTESDSVGANKDQYTNTQSTQIVQKQAILPSTIMGFVNFEGIVKLVGTAFFHVHIIPITSTYKIIAEPFILSDRMKIKNVSTPESEPAAAELNREEEFPLTFNS
jgi:hypothetical protein